MDAVIESILDNNSNIPYTVLVRAEFQSGTTIAPWGDNVFRVNLSGQSVYWNELGAGDKEYIGTGDLISVSSFEEGIELQNYTLNLSISGLPTDPGLIQDVKTAKYKNGSIVIYLALLNSNYDVLSDGTEQDGPVVLFAGRMDTMDISVGDTATINIQTSSRLADWERTRGGRYNRQTQGRYYDLSLDPSDPFYIVGRDEGFDYVESLRQLDLQWGGRVRLGAGYDGGGGRDRPGSSPNGPGTSPNWVRPPNWGQDMPTPDFSSSRSRE